MVCLATYGKIAQRNAVNAKGEVVTADHSTKNEFDRSFEFDGIGNRKKSVDGLDLTDPSATSYTANTLNQLETVGTVTRVHDADGNITDNGTHLYEWDAENRLIAIHERVVSGEDIVAGAEVATYAYDAYSRRISKTVAGVSTSFVYDVWNPIAEYSGTTLSKSYTWGMDLSGSMQGAGGVGGLLSVNDGSDTYYPSFDGNGNVSEYVDATGVVVAHYEYDVFGQVVASGTMKDDFTHQFSTKQLDSESGLHYYGYRYYDSSNGRWLGRDPLGERGGLNIFGMVMNSPIYSVDYLGLIDGKKECRWDLHVGHMTQEGLDGLNEFNGRQDRFEGADCGNNKIAFVTCGQDELLAHVPENQGVRLPQHPNTMKPTPEQLTKLNDRKNSLPNLGDVGDFDGDTVLGSGSPEDTLQSIDDMIAKAKEQCKKKNNCCSSIWINVKCDASGFDRQKKFWNDQPLGVGHDDYTLEMRALFDQPNPCGRAKIVKCNE